MDSRKPSVSMAPMLMAREGAAAPRVGDIALLAAYIPAPAKKAMVSQALALACCENPQARFAGVTQIVALLATSAEDKTVDRVSQVVELIAYKTGLPDPKRSRAWSFVLDGHTFYVLNLGEEGTFVYDTLTEQWAKFNTEGYGQWNLINGTMWGQNRIVGGDLLTDQIWEYVATKVLDEDWRDIVHAVTGKVQHGDRRYLACDAVRLAGSLGTLDEVNGATISLRYSDDDGKTWSDYFTIDLTDGDFSGEIAWRSLGSFADPGRIFEVSDVGGIIRIDGADAFINGFDDNGQSGE